MKKIFLVILLLFCNALAQNELPNMKCHTTRTVWVNPDGTTEAFREGLTDYSVKGGELLVGGRSIGALRYKPLSMVWGLESTGFLLMRVAGSRNFMAVEVLPNGIQTSFWECR